MTISCAECLGSTRAGGATGRSKTVIFLTPGGHFFWARSDFFGFLSHIYMVVTFYVNTSPTSAPLVSFHITPTPLDWTCPALAPLRSARLNRYLLTRARAMRVPFIWWVSCPAPAPASPASPASPALALARSLSLALYLTPAPFGCPIKPTLRLVHTLTRWSSSTYKLTIISLNFFCS